MKTEITPWEDHLSRQGTKLVLLLFVCFAFHPACRAEEASQANEDSKRSSNQRYIDQAELEFTNRDADGNYVIDEKEWQVIIADQREVFREELQKSEEQTAAADKDKDGAVSEEELDAWVVFVFKKKFSWYIKSEAFQEKKAAYDKKNGSASEGK